LFKENYRAARFQLKVLVFVWFNYLIFSTGQLPQVDLLILALQVYKKLFNIYGLVNKLMGGKSSKQKQVKVVDLSGMWLAIGVSTCKIDVLMRVCSCY
jgi:hypothetical protein